MKLNADEKEKRRLHYQANKESYKARAKKWKELNPEALKLSQKKNWLKLTYGLAWDEFMAKYEDQQGLCAICSIPLPLMHENRTKQPFVDHCHQTGKIRGLLCHHCNMGIGNFKETVSLLHKAEEYLKLWDSN